jgi:hypothetical protein
MATLIILDRPDARHIPYFAMGVPLALEDRAVDIDIHQTRIVGRRCLDWTRVHRGDDDIRFVATRNYLKPQTALYVNWALFRAEALADEFLELFPRYQFEKRMERIRRERQLLTERLEQQLRRGGFDLSRIAEEHLWTVAMRYVEVHDKITDLHRHERWLVTANGLGYDWLDKLAKEKSNAWTL